MKRDVEALAEGHYDVLVVGGGIYGVCIARDAALRGLSVALVEKEDFGHATSANSLKIIHGGLRYLQDGNLRLVRAMIRERKAWLRIAPHLVDPLPCLMPTTKEPSRSRALMAVAMSVNDLIAFDRNLDMHPAKRIPRSRLLSRNELRRRAPGIPTDGVNGGVMWYDAHVTNTERLLLAILLSAVTAGARVANYVEVVGFVRKRNEIHGVEIVDTVTGQKMVIRARLVVLSTGVWTQSLLKRCDVSQSDSSLGTSLAINIVTRQICRDYALALPTRSTRGQTASVRPPRTLFIVPWQGHSIVGTLHLPFTFAHNERLTVHSDVVAGFLAAVNLAYPEARLALADVFHVQAGFLPAHELQGNSGSVRLLRESQIVDHERANGLRGVISVEGVKYTTARRTAKKVVNLALQKLERSAKPCITDIVPVLGGDIGDYEAFLSKAEQSASPRVEAASIRHLASTYGTEYGRILAYLEEDPAWGRQISTHVPVLAAEIVHAVREEMAVRLTDVIQRRTILGAAGPPDVATVEACASMLSNLLGWSRRRRQDEIDHLYYSYQRYGLRREEPVIV